MPRVRLHRLKLQPPPVAFDDVLVFCGLALVGGGLWLWLPSVSLVIVGMGLLALGLLAKGQ